MSDFGVNKIYKFKKIFANTKRELLRMKKHGWKNKKKVFCI